MKPHLKTTVATLLASQTSQHEIHRKTGVDRKTIRAIKREMASSAPVTPAPMGEFEVATGDRYAQRMTNRDPPLPDRTNFS